MARESWIFSVLFSGVVMIFLQLMLLGLVGRPSPINAREIGADSRDSFQGSRPSPL
jgi:hypothetical protein